MTDKPIAEIIACQHDWVFLRTEKRIKPGGIGVCWLIPPTIAVDLFYCRKCLEQREVKHG